MINSVADYYNNSYSYKTGGKRSAASSVFQIESGLELTKSNQTISDNKCSALDGLNKERKSDLLSAYKEVNWKNEEQVRNFLNKGVELGYYTQEDLDAACIGILDPCMLYRDYSPSESDDNFIKDCLNFEIVQLKMATDFYQKVPEDLVEHITSLTKVWNFISDVQDLA